MVAKDGHNVQGEGKEGGMALKKGPWTAAEDAVLTEYVKINGEGNWNGVMRKCGLQRCGKSCRLRWANHLRPNLKKGAFTIEEESAIVHLHAKYGNKWARMASQLSGRTDNEIKNYWNTRMKRRQRAGLPIYPQDIQRESLEFRVNQHQVHQQTHKQQRQHRHRLDHHDHKQHESSPSSMQSFFPVHNYTHFSPPDTNKTSTPPQNPTQTFHNLNNYQFNFFSNDQSYLSSVSSNSTVPTYPSLNSPFFFNQTFTSLLLPTTTPPPIESTPENIDFNVTNTANVGPFEANHEFTSLAEMELPSNQTSMHSTTPASSSTSGGQYVKFRSPPTSNMVDHQHTLETFFPEKHRGLLDDMLMESQTISRNSDSSSKGKGRMVDMRNFEGESNEALPVSRFNDSSSTPSLSIGTRSMKEQGEEINCYEDDDELSSILKTFGDGNPVVDGATAGSARPSRTFTSATTTDATNATNTTDHDLTLGFCCWNNMPNIL